MPRRLLVVVNPMAGRGRRRWLRAVLHELERSAVVVRVEETAAVGHARRLAAGTAANDIDAIVIAGGDGTVNEAVNGLSDNPDPPALGVVPLGTANVLAVELGLPREPRRLAEMLARAPEGTVRPGRVNGHLFLIMASAGFDARVVARVSPGIKRRLGKLAYLWSAAVEFFHDGTPVYRVRCLRQELVAAGVVAARGRHYGGAFVITPEADLARPAFEVLALSEGGRGAILRQAAALGLGRFHRLPELRAMCADELEIEGPAGEPVQADGDIVAHLPARIDIAPGPLRIIGASGSS